MDKCCDTCKWNDDAICNLKGLRVKDTDWCEKWNIIIKLKRQI